MSIYLGIGWLLTSPLKIRNPLGNAGRQLIRALRQRAHTTGRIRASSTSARGSVSLFKPSNT
ncbi:MAG TPA: hypothetical protein VFA81_08525 [Burkholderiales bacterium]|nr:hypothetical protein [Burkholderiales bacterium]